MSAIVEVWRPTNHSDRVEVCNMINPLFGAVGKVSEPFFFKTYRTIVTLTIGGEVIAALGVQELSGNEYRIRFGTVHPTFQGMGYGTQLYGAIEGAVLEEGEITPITIVSFVDKDEEPFMTAVGFTPVPYHVDSEEGGVAFWRKTV
jgi:GNAT superfamily N-acetyltransferase